MTYGVYLRLLRKRAGYTLRGLGKKLECSASYLCDVEHGRRAAIKTPQVAESLGLNEIESATLLGLATIDRFKRKIEAMGFIALDYQGFPSTD